MTGAVALAAAQGAAYLADVPSLDPDDNGGGARGAEFGKASPIGLLLILALLLGIVFLIRSMNRHLRKVPESFDEPVGDPDSDEEGPGHPNDAAGSAGGPDDTASDTGPDDVSGRSAGFGVDGRLVGRSTDARTAEDDEAAGPPRR